MTVEINEALARKVLHVVDAGLVNGMGEPTPGKMCVESPISYAIDAAHVDQPACISLVLLAIARKVSP